ncbi:MAG: hypothetical protein ABIE22_03900 [archaeon]
MAEEAIKAGTVYRTDTPEEGGEMYFLAIQRIGQQGRKYRFLGVQRNRGAGNVGGGSTCFQGEVSEDAETCTVFSSVRTERMPKSEVEKLCVSDGTFRGFLRSVFSGRHYEEGFKNLEI